MKVVNMGALFKISLAPFFTQIPPEIIVYGNQVISATMKTYALDYRQLKFHLISQNGNWKHTTHFQVTPR